MNKIKILENKKNTCILCFDKLMLKYFIKK